MRQPSRTRLLLSWGALQSEVTMRARLKMVIVLIKTSGTTPLLWFLPLCTTAEGSITPELRNATPLLRAATRPGPL